VRDKRFREDLFYRLNVITIQVPPLRDRHEDVPLLAQHFLRVYAAKNNRQLDGFTDEALGCLEAYSWPGNVRELENVVERAVVLARGLRVDATDLPDAVRERSVMLLRDGPAAPADATTMADGVFQVRIGTPLAEVEARLLEETLRLNHGNKTLTAKMLGIDPKTVFRKLKQGEADDPASGDAPASR
jgi:two-component system response regulator HydG